MRGEPGDSGKQPASAFEAHFDRLVAVVHQRMEIEWRAHRRRDLEKLEPDLLELLREFGALLRVVYRHSLTGVLREEAGWYAATLASRGPGQDAFALLLDSWIVAIQGLIPPPQCNALAAPLQTLRDDLPVVFAAASQGGPPAPPEVGRLADRLAAGDRDGVLRFLDGQRAAGLPAYESIVRFLLPAMAEIGRRWERNELAVYQEHLATETTIRLLAGLAAWEAPVASVGRKALTSCVPNDHMQIIAMALSVYLELRGWSVASLGQGLPAAEIALAVEDIRPDAVFLSLAMVSRLSEALDVIDLLGRGAARPKVFIGGRGGAAGRALLSDAGARVVQSFEEAFRLATGAEDSDA
jgi:methanogenic corrinoid protein MtbC1